MRCEKVIALTASALVLFASGAAFAEEHAAKTRTWNATAGDVKNVAGKPGVAAFRPLGSMSSDVEILYGDPAVPGQPFVIRILELPGNIVPPHTHPVDENITVVQGTWYFGLGEEFDKSKLKKLPTGSYAYAPKGTAMFGFSPDSAIVQVHGIGPFEIHWLHGATTLADASAGTTFRYRRGDSVKAPRGSGRIREGYASGELIEYEIETVGGKRFIAQEHELQRD